MPEEDWDSEWAFRRRFGDWDATSPAEVRDLFDGAPFVWWVVGGWSLEADPAGPARRHEDVDVAVLARDAAAVRTWLAGWHIWEAHEGIRPLPPHEEPREGREQWWVRRDAWSPWVMDVLLTPTDGDDWLFKKDHRVRRPLTEVVRRGSDGVPYALPEVSLLHKSFNDRRKDVADLERTWPRLSPAARSWLRDAVALVAPEGTSFRSRLAGLPG